MKRVLIAGVLGGLLLLGTPTLASSAQRDSTRAEKGDGDKGGNKGGDNKGGDNKGHRGDKGDRGDRGDRDGRRGDRDGHHRHGYGRGGYGYGYGGYYGGSYGQPYDCYRDASGYTTCEEYGGDGYPYGYNYRGARPGRVLVRDMAFNPPEVDVRVGEPVVWEFADREPHTVTADNGSFDSGQKINDEFRLRFDRPGSYSYHCSIHPDMRGRVAVHG